MEMSRKLPKKKTHELIALNYVYLFITEPPQSLCFDRNFPFIPPVFFFYSSSDNGIICLAVMISMIHKTLCYAHEVLLSEWRR